MQHLWRQYFHLMQNLWCCSSFSLCSAGLDLLPFAVTFLMSFWEVQYGIVAGVAVSGAVLLYNVARPRIKVESPAGPGMSAGCWVVVVSGLCFVLQVSDHGVLVMQLCSGLTFPATDHLSRFIHAHALQGEDCTRTDVFVIGCSPNRLPPPPVSPPRSVVLDCHHVSAIDYTVISELKDLLRQFQLQRVKLVFSGLKVSSSGLRASR